MDTENKENLTTIHHVFNASDISIDSLNPVDSDMNITKEIKGEHDHSPEENSYVGPALVEASSLNLMELSQSNTAEKVADTVETASALASSLINDSLLISLDASLNSQPVHKETEKYANDLACELINDTNQIVRSIHSHEDKYSEDKTNVQETAVNNEVKEEPDDTGDIEGYSRSDGPSADRRSNQSAADAANVDVDAAEAIAAEPEPASAPVMTIDEQQIEQDREPKLEREPEPEPEIEQQQQPAPESELQEKAPQLELAPEPKIVAESTSELQEQQKPRSLESLQPQPQDTQQNEQRQQRGK